MIINVIVSILSILSPYLATLILAFIVHKTFAKSKLSSYCTVSFGFHKDFPRSSLTSTTSSSKVHQNEMSEFEMVKKSEDFYKQMHTRRTVRFFSRDPVPLEVIENIIKTAGTAPGIDFGEPWTFVVVANPGMKKKIREIVEDDEKINYEKRMGDKWVKDLRKLRTTWKKPYLEDVPYLIIILKQLYTYDDSGRQIEHHNNELSAGIASGFLLTALHKAGLATVTSTPLNIGPSLRQLLDRPDNEKIILLLAVGYPSDSCTVPDLHRKELSDIMLVYN